MSKYRYWMTVLLFTTMVRPLELQLHFFFS